MTSGPHHDVISFTTPPRDATRRARHVSSIRATTPPTFPDLPPILIPHTSHLSPTDGRAHTGGGPTCKKKSREGHGGPGVFTAQRFESERDKIGKKKERKKERGENFTPRLTRIPLLPSSSLPASSRCLPLSLARAAYRHKQSPGGLGHGSFWKLPRWREEGGGGEGRGTDLLPHRGRSKSRAAGDSHPLSRRAASTGGIVVSHRSGLGGFGSLKWWV
uniref:Uncharacterized protein n=1 Tax=Oryza rufipogon TaxID=4529 RepID=A0A0E0N461_ORYRU